MRINKIVIWSLLLALVFGVNVALAKDMPNGDPFKAIWDAIAGIQQQIDDIQLNSGPQGPQGIQGIGLTADSFYTKTETRLMLHGSIMTETYLCDNNDIVISGGVSSTSGVYEITDEASQLNEYIGAPSPDSLQGWISTLYLPSGSDYYFTYTIKCLRVE